MPYVRTRLGRWFFEERGAAKRRGDAAIVLWPSLLCDGGMFRHQIEPLSALGRVVVFDGPGHGKSEVPPSFSLEDNADALLDAFGELRIDRAVIVGLSWGGMLGMRMALQHASRVRALALLDSSAEAERPARAVKYRLFASLARRIGMPPLLIDKQIVPLFFAKATLRDRPEIAERFVRAAQGFSREGMARASLAVVVHRKDILAQIDSIRVPTLVLCGREDCAIEPVHSERIAQRIQGARMVYIEAAGHLSALEQPGAVNEVLIPFVEVNVSSTG
jgi:pimeloyl-ACP methyl ester carboxylesterase